MAIFNQDFRAVSSTIWVLQKEFQGVDTVLEWSRGQDTWGQCGPRPCPPAHTLTSLSWTGCRWTPPQWWMALWAPQYCTSPAKETCHFNTETSKDNISKYLLRLLKHYLTWEGKQSSQVRVRTGPFLLNRDLSVAAATKSSSYFSCCFGGRKGHRTFFSLLWSLYFRVNKQWKCRKQKKRKHPQTHPQDGMGLRSSLLGTVRRQTPGVHPLRWQPPLEGGELLLQDVQAGAPYMGSQERTTQDEPSVGNLLPSVRMVSLLISTEQDREKIHTGPFANW